MPQNQINHKILTRWNKWTKFRPLTIWVNEFLFTHCNFSLSTRHYRSSFHVRIKLLQLVTLHKHRSSEQKGVSYWPILIFFHFSNSFLLRNIWSNGIDTWHVCFMHKRNWFITIFELITGNWFEISHRQLSLFDAFIG